MRWPVQALAVRAAFTLEQLSTRQLCTRQVRRLRWLFLSESAERNFAFKISSRAVLVSRVHAVALWG